MISCPVCGANNIEGSDECGECGQSLSDLHLPTPATHVERSLLNDHLGLLVPSKPISVAVTTPIRDVLQIMVDQSIGCVVVVEDGKTVGIFSERDALMKLNAQAESLMDRPVSEFMTANPETLQTTAKIAFAVHRMDVGSFRHLPVVNDDGSLAGVISVRDILRYLTQKMTATDVE